jgi:hypothetical protein
MASMSILDDAIREHLELKRAHGADEAELKRLEDEAFGPPQRPEEPDPFAEAPTEFLGTAEGVAEPPPSDPPSARREPNIADLQEAPPQASATPEAPPADPAEESQPAAEEHEAIADQPTEFFDVEADMGQGGEAPTDAPAPSDEDLLDAEHAEPRLAPVDPLEGIEASAAAAEAAEEPLLDDEEEEDDFFSEQRLSDELNQALEMPLPGEPTVDRELEEEGDEAEAEEEPPDEEDEHDEEDGERPAASDLPEEDEHEDVLEDTPDFLEDAPEDDDLWFEQRPPKDFDFDD